MRRPWPFQHLGLKILSLALAVLLWMAVAGEQTVERGLRVPLELQQYPSGLEVTGDLPTTVDVRVRGASAALSRVAAGEVVAVLDLRGARPGRRLFPLTPEQVRVPFGVEVVQVTPSAIAITFEPSASRELPVVPSIEGRPAPGYIVGRRISDPAVVEIVGPQSAVRQATEALTEPISIAGARQPVRETVTIGVADPVLRLKNPKPATVMVDIVPAPLERTLRGRALHLRNLASALQAEATPEVVDVTLRGRRDALDQIEPDEVVAYVDVAGLGPGEYTLTAHADATLDAGVARIEPSTVKVRITSGKR